MFHLRPRLIFFNVHKDELQGGAAEQGTAMEEDIEPGVSIGTLYTHTHTLIHTHTILGPSLMFPDLHTPTRTQGPVIKLSLILDETKQN